MIINESKSDNNALENFKAVLESAYESYEDINESHDFVGICLNMIESDNMDFINESIGFEDDESRQLNEMAINVTDPKIVKEKKGTGISVKVNGKEYRYVSPTRSTEDLFKSFMGMYRHANAGYKALNYLKSNSLCYYGCKSPKGEEFVGRD